MIVPTISMPFSLFHFVLTVDKLSVLFHYVNRGNQKDVNIVRVQQRAVDIVQFWVEGFYSVDFERNELLLDRLESLIKQWVSQFKLSQIKLYDLWIID